MDIYLTTERIVLRRLTPSDVDDVWKLDSDPEVMRYLTGGKPTARETIERTLLDGYDEPGYGRWAAVEKATGAFVGWFALSRVAQTPPGEAELGYRMRRCVWGRGYATEGARALLRKAFTELDTRRVWAQTMAVNPRSRRVMERAGLRFVRVFHLAWDDPIEGTEHGEVEYEILREDWLAVSAVASAEVDVSALSGTAGPASGRTARYDHVEGIQR